MKKKILLATTLAFLSTAVFAQAWQWRDKNGQVQISDSPPPAGAKDVKEIGKHIPPDDLLSEEEQAELNAQSDEEFQKRREERLKREEEEAQAASEAKDKRRSCADAQAGLAAKRASRRSTNPAQRAAKREAIAELEASVDEYCN